MKTKQQEHWTLIEDDDWVRRMAEMENNEPISVGGFLRFLPPDEAKKVVESNQEKEPVAVAGV
jgi:hypothetical protein